jgi:hypothetical protein
LKLGVIGKVLFPQVNLDKKYINFGNVILGDHADTLIRIFNETAELSIHFNFKSTPFFSATPKSGAVKSKESLEVLITYKAAELGEHEVFIYFFFFLFCFFVFFDILLIKRKS